MSAIRVLVADDDAMMRGALSDLVRAQAAFELVGVADGTAQAIELALEHQPDVALVDVRMPDGGGRRIARELRRAAPRIAVLALSAFDDRGNVFEMLRAGAVGYLVKGSTFDEVVAGIVTAASGRGVLSSKVAGHVIEKLVGEPRPRRDDAGATIRVLAVDGDRDALAALAELIARDGALELVGVAADRFEAATLAATHRPDVALVDVQTAGGGELAVSDILRSSPDTDVLALSAQEDPRELFDMLAAGAVGYLVKSADGILREIHAVAGGGAALAPEITKSVVDTLVVRLEGERRESDERRHERDVIRSIIAGGAGLRMVFQPIVELDGGRLFAVEALARFDVEPRRTPDVWFQRAAALGLGVELELVAMRAALARLPDIAAKLCINLSPAALSSPGLTDAIGSAARDVVVELTEHAPVDDYAPLALSLRPLRGAGVRLAIDDAGAGFASLRHILNLEPSIIKLDISLCRSIDTDPRRRALAEVLCGFAQDIGADLVAEGIETAGELATLRSLPVRYGQGYAIGRPRELPIAT